MLAIIISIINHTLPSTIRAVIGTPTCTSMASNIIARVIASAIRPYEYK